MQNQSKIAGCIKFLIILISIQLLFSIPILGDENNKAKAEYDVLIKGGRLIDGTGNPWFYADVGIRNGIIVAVGSIKDPVASRVIDAKGKYISPGFIDLHTHADGPSRGANRGLRSDDPKRRAAPNLVSQGITTLIVNHDGRSPASIADQREQLEKKKFGPNTLLLVGHNSIRAFALSGSQLYEMNSEAMQKVQRYATSEEIDKMRALIQEGMAAGAYGLSAGLEYVPGRWSNTEEVIALVAELKENDGVFICHERASGQDPMWYLPSHGNEQVTSFLDNIVELIEVSEKTGVKVVATHIKARGAHFWGSSHAAIQMVNRARKRGVRIWADQYPYNTSGSDGSTRLIPQWVVGTEVASLLPDSDQRNYAKAIQIILKDDKLTKKLKRDVEHELARRGGPENIVVMDYTDTSFVGKSLYELSNTLGISPFNVAVKLQVEGNPKSRGGARLRGFSMSEIDLEAYGAQEWCATATDAGIALPGDGFVHARFYGTFPRKIRKYAIEQGIMSVEAAIRSSTSLPAQILGFRNRGLVREGFHADLVIFDLDEIRDTATFFNPHQYADGIDYVMINGEFVVDGGELTWKLPGVIITPEDGRKKPFAID